jgi:hypothetical protein
MEPREAGYGRGKEHCWAHLSHKEILEAWEPHQSEIHTAVRLALERLGLKDEEV